MKVIAALDSLKGCLSASDACKAVAEGILQAHPDANVIWGAALDENLQDEMRVTVIATGFDMAQLPVIDEPVSARGNRVEITLGNDNNQLLKHGTPYVAAKEIRITRQRNTGIPVLFTEDPRLIAELEDEPAYFRKEKMLAEQEKAAAAAAAESSQVSARTEEQP